MSTTMKTLIYYFLPLFLIATSIGEILAQEQSKHFLTSHIVDLGKVANGDENFEGYERLSDIFGEADIVMLGEQSHGDATTTETKIKLIKYLHEKLGFNILAFESGFYGCHKVWEEIQNGENVRFSLAKGVNHLWAMTKEFDYMSEYIEENIGKKNPLKIAGFDFGYYDKIEVEHYTGDLKNYLSKIDCHLIYSDEWNHFEEIMSDLGRRLSKHYKREDAVQDTAFISKMISFLKREKEIKNSFSNDFWLQSLKGAKAMISDLKLKTDNRDFVMAENLLWLKEQFPGEKIICWGATSHFVYNSEEIKMKSPIIQILAGRYYKKHSMMGDIIKEKYKDKAIVVGFTAYEGYHGVVRSKELHKPKKNSLEYLLGSFGYDNFMIPLKNMDTGNLISRPLGYSYMKNDLSNIMDVIVFNRVMKFPTFNKKLFLKVYPGHRYIKPDPQE